MVVLFALQIPFVRLSGYSLSTSIAVLLVSNQSSSKQMSPPAQPLFPSLAQSITSCKWGIINLKQTITLKKTIIVQIKHGKIKNLLSFILFYRLPLIRITLYKTKTFFTKDLSEYCYQKYIVKY